MKDRVAFIIEKEDLEKINEALIIIKKNRIFNNLSKSGLFRHATLQFCDKVLIANNILNGQDKDGKQMLQELSTWS